MYHRAGAPSCLARLAAGGPKRCPSGRQAAPDEGEVGVGLPAGFLPELPPHGLLWGLAVGFDCAADGCPEAGVGTDLTRTLQLQQGRFFALALAPNDKAGDNSPPPRHGASCAVLGLLLRGGRYR
eukprot:scaffold279661_cov38-Prasinocladus_malaysianus.AAC.1